MKILKNENELIGKTIAFAHMAAFAEAITLATVDGSVLVVRQTFDEDTDESQIHIRNEHLALRYIENNDYVREQLGVLGIFDIDTYRKKKEEERLKRAEEYKAKKLQEEYELYKKLKSKFEPSI